MENLRLICFTAGMMEDFEVIRTDAPDVIIEEQLRLNCTKEEAGEVIELGGAYSLLESKGYTVELVGNHLSINEIPGIVDRFFDWMDYYGI